MAKHYKNSLEDPSIYCVIATARVMADADDCCIRDKLGSPHHLIHRKPGDERSGGLLKVLGLKKLLALKQFKHIKRVDVWEDNCTYLQYIVDHFVTAGYDCRGHYVSSSQGH